MTPTATLARTRTTAPVGTVPTPRRGQGHTPRLQHPSWVGLSVAIVVALAPLGGMVAVAAGRVSLESDAAATRVQVIADATVGIADEAVLASLQSRATDAAAADHRAEVVAVVTAAAAAGATTLAATPHATPEITAALQAAIAAASATAADGGVSIATLLAAADALTGAQTAATASQAQWQAAEDARIAAEKAAAEKAAADAAAAKAATKSSAPKVSRSAARPAAGAAAAPATAAPASSSIRAIGDSINAYRASQGLSALSISESSSLNAHAASMAATGDQIWHSGADNIVGFIEPASASGLVSEWIGSPAHNAQMLRTDISRMSIGAATSSYGGLFSAIKFS